MTGVVRVAVPVPENFVEKKPTPQVIPPQPKSIYDDKYAQRDHQRSSTYDNMPTKPNETKVVKSEPQIHTENIRAAITETVTGSVTGNVAETTAEIKTTEVKVVEQDSVVTKEETVTNVSNGDTFEGQFVHATGKAVSVT